MAELDQYIHGVLIKRVILATQITLDTGQMPLYPLSTYSSKLFFESAADSKPRDHVSVWKLPTLPRFQNNALLPPAIEGYDKSSPRNVKLNIL